MKNSKIMEKSKIIFLSFGVLAIFFLAVFYSLIWQKLPKAPLPDNVSNSFDSGEVARQFPNQLIIKSAVLPSERFGLACVKNSATHKIYCFGGYTGEYRYFKQMIEYQAE